MATNTPSTGDFAFFAGRHLVKAHAADQSVGRQNFFNHIGRDKLDFGVGLGAVNHDFRSAKIIAPVNQVNLARVARKEVGFFHGGIAAADDRDGLSAKKIAIACRASGDATANEFFFALQAQQTRRGAGGDDQRLVS